MQVPRLRSGFLHPSKPKPGLPGAPSSARGSDAAQTPQLDKIFKIAQVLVQSPGTSAGWAFPRREKRETRWREMLLPQAASIPTLPKTGEGWGTHA
ncbi:MAG TPA: hypothetical protein VH596_15680 [Terriglobales bacterium]